VRRRATRALLLPLLAALLAACTFQLDVDVDVAPDGSGTVTVTVALDDAAVARIGGDLGAVLALDDLRADGWTVDGPTREADRHTRLRVHRTFEHPSEVAEAFDELSGGAGPFQDLAVTRSRSLTETRWGFTGHVDLRKGAGARGGPSAPDLAALGEELGQSLSRLVQVRVRVRLPGDVSSNATTKADNGAVWQVAFGGEPLDLEAHGTQSRTGVLLLFGLAGVVALVLLVYGLVRLAGRTPTPERDLRR
jgi:hypothetical protein